MGLGFEQGIRQYPEKHQIPRLMPFDALLFDFDGVLADTEPLHHSSWNQVLEPFGIKFEWEYYQKNCVGIADAVLARRLELNADEGMVVCQKQAAFRSAMESKPPFHEDALLLVRELAMQYKLAVVSSS